MLGRILIRVFVRGGLWVKLIGLAAWMTVVLAACGAQPGQQATAELQPLPVETVTEELQTPPVEAVPEELRPLPVEAVTVQVGVGSPIPVDVVASGTWNDLCAQLARVEQKRDGNRIEINLSASEEQAGCPPDNLGVPFRVAVPLNPVEMEIGEYQISVNGVETTFEWDPVKILNSRPYDEAAIVSHVGVEIGVDSPTSVNVVVSGEFPNTCAQLGTIDQIRSPGFIQIHVMAQTPPGPAPDGSECRQGGLPFRLSIPLNSDGLEPGNYTIDVNGQQNNFDWPPSRG